MVPPPPSFSKGKGSAASFWLSSGSERDSSRYRRQGVSLASALRQTIRSTSVLAIEALFKESLVAGDRSEVRGWIRYGVPDSSSQPATSVHRQSTQQPWLQDSFSTFSIASRADCAGSCSTLHSLLNSMVSRRATE